MIGQIVQRTVLCLTLGSIPGVFAPHIHHWMRSYFAVIGTGYFAVTGEDGLFTLPDLPPGKYTVTAWHETYGTRNKEITVLGGQQMTVVFVYNTKAR